MKRSNHGPDDLVAILSEITGLKVIDVILLRINEDDVKVANISVEHLT